MIKFTSVFKAFPKGGLALKDVSFHVAKGEFAFLTGHSGAGKSTVMKLIYAEERPTSGEVRVSGYNVNEMRPRDVPLLRRKLGRSEEHTSELQSPCNLVCRLLLEKKKIQINAC